VAERDKGEKVERKKGKRGGKEGELLMGTIITVGKVASSAPFVK